ncbi:MAG: hypothetical protein AMJ94_11695 [Deltaproteobacteria bacterium SM23_61]|nr:MAG: hypothetical protein AMJ94_11695 [Deltaproteobacteria bacterium SM23_61]
MLSMATTIVVAIILLLLVHSSMLTAQTTIADEAMHAAEIALAYYVKLTKETGMPAEQSKKGAVGDIQLGKPYKVLTLSLEELATATITTSISDIIHDYHVIWFPVWQNGEIWAELEIVRRNGKWRGRSFGGGRRARQVLRARDKIANAIKSGEADITNPDCILRVPEIGAWFISAKHKRDMKIIPITSRLDRFGLEEGKLYNSREFKHKISTIKR